jgi:transcriptional regulator with XRE-family HTH domain
MSEELGLSQGAVSLYERGARHPRREKVVQFALALGVNPQEALDALIADTPGLEATPPPNPAIEALAARLASLSAEDQQYILSLIERLLQSPTRQE